MNTDKARSSNTVLDAEHSDILAAISKKMKDAGQSIISIRGFADNFLRLIAGESGLISEKDIDSVSDLPALSTLANHSDFGGELLNQTVMIKLNGGLGTSMGLDSAKSLLPAKENISFLDITVTQVLALRETFDCRLPLIFMNSFRTARDCAAILNKNRGFILTQGEIPFSFLQHQVPKIKQEDFFPVSYPEDPELEWCPPGHGDIYSALYDGGLLKELLAKGFRYAFVSNSDNLGATLDLNILGYFAKNNLPFLMEVALRTEADKKGGHLARLKSSDSQASVEGNLILREIAQCPPTETELFQDTARYSYFNTNSLWLDLKVIADHLEECGGIFPLPLIKNKKTVNPNDRDSTPVYQLETAMGSAISTFSDAQALLVPRTRFAPVKKTDDLLALWSDLFLLTEKGEIIPNPKRSLGTVLIDLDPRYFQFIADFQERFAHGAPSLQDCESLTVRGNVYFGKEVTVKGRVTLVHDQAEPLHIPSGTILEP